MQASSSSWVVIVFCVDGVVNACVHSFAREWNVSDWNPFMKSESDDDASKPRKFAIDKATFMNDLFNFFFFFYFSRFRL